MLQLIIYTRESNSLADEATLNEGKKAKKYLEQQEFFDPELADEECEKGVGWLPGEPEGSTRSPKKPFV